MIHPLFHLISTRPHLLAEHVGAYGELAGEELLRLTARWRRRAIFTAAGACAIGLAVLLGCIAAMLWAVMPGINDHAHWVLIGIPSVLLFLGLVCLMAASSAASEEGMFDTLKEQFSADMTMLRNVTATAS